MIDRPRPAFAELHCHSTFSLLDGASDPEPLVERALELGLAALALTDHDDVGGVVRFGTAAAAAGLPGILGAELTVEVSLPGKRAGLPPRLTHLVCLAESREGWGNITTLITRAREEHARGSPRVGLELLAAHADGIFALSGCPRGWVPQLLAAGVPAAARRAAGTLAEIFRGRFALECWDHSLPEERALTRALVPLARALDLPWVVTNDVHYARRRDRAAHDVLSALRHGATLDEMGTRLRPNGEWHLKGYAQLAERWRGMEEGLTATLPIAERCAFRLAALKPAFPLYPGLPAGVTADEYLATLVERGAQERWGWKRTARHDRQIERELTLIARLGLAGYFLIVWDIARFARREGILCQGRGSAANSAICYCLDITAVDPIAHNLLFERFLSEERQEYPDIDIDFAHRERERVLQYVYERYGRDHAAMVCEHITWRNRSAIRDAARTLGFSPDQADALVRSLERRDPGRRKAPEGPIPMAASGFDGRDPRVQKLAGIIEGLRGAPRHRGIHVGGFVLTAEPLHTVVAIEPASMEDRTVIQWEKDDLDGAGLIKIDLLGLGMLTVLQDCLAYLRTTRGKRIDLGQLEQDPAVYDDLCRADSVGVFQVESRAQMNTLPRLKPRNFYDLVVQVSLIRPGPIQGDMVNPYLRRRAGLEPVTYLHPSLESVLKRTLGVPLFQEQGMQVAVAAARFTPGEADTLRKAMGYKRTRRKMAEIGQRMLDGMKANGIADDVAQRIFHQIEGFADYGFPESHAASFALIVYASAYLRHHYAPEFLCAMLNAQPMGFYAPGTLIEDARRHGVRVAPVNVRRSSWDHTLEPSPRPGAPPIVRLGLRAVIGLGGHSRERIERACGLRVPEHGGKAPRPFTSIADFVHRTGLDRRALRALAGAGAFDVFVQDEPPARRRRAALWGVLVAERESSATLTLPLFPESKVPESLPAFAPVELTEADYRLTGLSLNGHPLKHLRPLLDPNGVSTARGLRRHRDGERVAHAGLVICRQRPQTAKGFCFLTLEDETGTVNVVITPARYEEQAQLISTSPLLLVRGVLQVAQGVYNIRAKDFVAMRAGAGEESVRGHDYR
ncbi:MAG: error-prone DNA polymerase [Gemmatimonadaceae bacterium]